MGESSGSGPLAVLAKRIAAYLQYRMPQVREITVHGLRRLPIGSSKENLAFTARWREDGKARRQRFLIRRELPAGVLETKAETEYRLMAALWETGVPVPRMYWLETDPQWLDYSFLVEEFVNGESSWRRLAQADAQRSDAVIRRLVEILATQHTLDWTALGLEFLGVPRHADDCAQRLIDHWTDVLQRHRVEPQPTLAALLQWLKRHKPKEVSRVSLIHGDPGPGNFLYRGDRIIAVVDWEMAHLGDPMDDVAWLCWRMSATGLPFDREQLLKLYAEVSGIPVDVESVRYYEVFSNVRAAIACVSGLHSFCLEANQDLNMAYTGLVIYRWCVVEAARLAGF